MHGQDRFLVNGEHADNNPANLVYHSRLLMERFDRESILVDDTMYAGTRYAAVRGRLGSRGRHHRISVQGVHRKC